MDSEAIAFLATCDHVAINRWLVQLHRGGQWFTAYFADPPGGPVIGKCDSVETALRVVIARAQGRPDGQ